MEVNFAHICDYATVSQDGKLSVLGIFGQINAAQVPVIHAQMFLAFEIGFDYTEVGREFNAEVQIVDEDGHAIWGVKGAGTMRLPTAPKPGDRPTAGQIFAITNLRFAKVGTYDVNLVANGKHAKRLQLKVVPISTPQH